MQRDQAHQQRGDQVERVEQEQKHLRLAAQPRGNAPRVARPQLLLLARRGGLIWRSSRVGSSNGNQIYSWQLIARGQRAFTAAGGRCIPERSKAGTPIGKGLLQSSAAKGTIKQRRLHANPGSSDFLSGPLVSPDGCLAAK